MTNTPGVLLVEDHDVVRADLRAVLERSGVAHVVAEATTVDGAAQAMSRLQPDVAVVAARLPDGSGVLVARRAREVSPRTRVLILTSDDEHDDEAFLAGVLAGAVGHLRREVPVLDLPAAVAFAAGGGSTISATEVDRVMRRVVDTLITDQRSTDLIEPSDLTAATGLEDQERRVLELLAQGRGNRAIAVSTGLAENTVEDYVSIVLDKLHRQRRTQAAQMAARRSRPENSAARGARAPRVGSGHGRTVRPPDLPQGRGTGAS